jgi:hypothetical protein
MKKCLSGIQLIWLLFGTATIMPVFFNNKMYSRGGRVYSLRQTAFQLFSLVPVITNMSARWQCCCQKCTVVTMLRSRLLVEKNYATSDPAPTFFPWVMQWIIQKLIPFWCSSGSSKINDTAPPTLTLEYRYCLKGIIFKYVPVRYPVILNEYR